MPSLFMIQHLLTHATSLSFEPSLEGLVVQTKLLPVALIFGRLNRISYEQPRAMQRASSEINPLLLESDLPANRGR